MTLYRGRFAPTPSGPLHFGSLFAAVISYLDAKSNEGDWLLRIEDIDPPREQPGAAADILATLEAHFLYWDETETYQSNNTERYEQVLSDLHQANRLFWCQCSRKSLAGHSVYPGHCYSRQAPEPDSAARFRVDTTEDQFSDLFQGAQKANIRQDYGDVVVRRRDGLFAYQLAVVTDDIEDRISHVVRGIDLLDSVYWQRELYRALGKPCPEYGHFAVIMDKNNSQKLSKQNLATAINSQTASENLGQVFKLLELDITVDKPEQMLKAATSQWQRRQLFGLQTLHLTGHELD